MKINISKKPYILKNNDFRTIQIQVMFPIKFRKEDLAFNNLLPNMLQFMNKKYPSEEEFVLAKKELYVLGTHCGYFGIGLNGYFGFNLIIPDTDSLKEDLLEEQLSLFSEMIYNPLVKNYCFSSFELEKEKKNLLIGIDNALKNIGPYQNIRLREIVDEDGILSLDLSRNTYLIEEVTTSNLYDYYRKNIIDNSPVIFVMGNVDENRINELCDKYLYKNFKDKVFDSELYYFMKLRDNILEVVDESSFNNSCLSIVYKLKDATKDDYIYLNFIRDLLISLSSRILSKILRDDLEIVYSVQVIPYTHYGLLEVKAFINKDNMEITKEKIIDVINSLKNPDIIRDGVSNLIERRRIDVIKKKDNKGLIFEDFIDSTLGISNTLEDYYEKYKNISCEDISEFVNRLVLDTIYFLKEKEDE